MEENATPPLPRGKSNMLPIFILIFVIVSSVLTSGVYFYFLRVVKPKSEAQVLSNTDEKSDWKQYLIENANVLINYPGNFDYQKSENSVILKSDEYSLSVLYEELNDLSLSDYVDLKAKGLNITQVNTTQIKTRMGLSIYKDGMSYRYFPASRDGVIEIAYSNTGDNSESKIEEIIQKIEFTPLANGN